MKKKAKRTPSTDSTSSRTGLVKRQNEGWKIVSDVLLVCELLLFIALSTLAGKDTAVKGPNKSRTVCSSQCCFLRKAELCNMLRLEFTV